MSHGFTPDVTRSPESHEDAGAPGCAEPRKKCPDIGDGMGPVHHRRARPKSVGSRGGQAAGEARAFTGSIGALHVVVRGGAETGA